MRAKPMVSLIVDSAIMSKFLVDTLEAREPVSASALFCIGETNDAWQQTSEKMLSKYTVDAIDADGWMVCVPKPDNSVEFFEITMDAFPNETTITAPSVGYIRGQWGETIFDESNLQSFVKGDIIARNREDRTDVWVVARKIWINSYTEIT
jgi:hypothetical protein